MDYIPLINIIVLLIGSILFVISFLNYTFAFAIWLVLLPIVGQIIAFEGLEILPAERIVTSLLFMAALIKLKGNWKKVPDSSLFLYYLLFISSLLLSSAVSEVPLQSLGRSLTFLVPLMMGIMALAAVVENENGLPIIINAIIIGFAITIAYAMIEFLTQRNYLIDMGIIQQDIDYLSEIRYGLGGRITSFFGQPVYAALYFLVILPLIVFYNKYYVKNPVIKVTYLILLALGLIAIFLTGTRAVYLTLIIVPFVHLFFKKGKKMLTSKLFYVYLIGLFLLPFLLPRTFVDYTLESFRIHDPFARASENLVGRLQLTETLWGFFNQNVLLGLGPGYIQKMAKISEYFVSISGLENQYASLLAESGIIGFLTFMVFVIRAIQMGWKTCRGDTPFTSDWAIMTISIFTMVMIIAVSVSILNGPIIAYLMMYLGIMIGLRAHQNARSYAYNRQTSKDKSDTARAVPYLHY